MYIINDLQRYALKHFLDLCYGLLGKMRWTASKYTLLTFLLTPFYPAKVLFSQLYFVTDAHSVWSFSNKEVEVEKHPD